MRSLRETWSAQDQQRSFDRCLVGSEGCRGSSIKAHNIPLVSLRLIADQTNRIMATSGDPPRDPLTYDNQEPLAERSIKSFSAGRWACSEHDKMFASIDNTAVDFRDEHDVFLLIYRTTLRATQWGLRTASRMAVPMIDPLVESPVGLPDEYSRQLEHAAREASFMAMRVLYIKLQMDKMLRKGSYRQIRVETATWRGEPVAAGAGMAWREGPGDGLYWGGRDDVLPVWMVLLPQEGQQAIATASVRGYDKRSRDIHRGVFGDNGKPRHGGRIWARAVSNKLFENSIDIGISTNKWRTLNTRDREALQSYLHARSVSDVRSATLPNLFDACS